MIARDAFAGVRASDVAYVAFALPDLARARDFLRDFGFRDAGMADGVLHMAGHGGQPFIYRAEAGAPGFAGLAFSVDGPDELATLAAMAGAEVEPLDAPGGGHRVRLTDPDGFAVDAVAGRRDGEPGARRSVSDWNSASAKPRIGSAKRLDASPAHVERLGHIVLGVSDFARSEAWYKRHFGLLTSDEIATDDGGAMGAFLRLDRGDEPTDHHSLFLAQVPGKPGFRHAAFEVRDMDDLMTGHDHLAAQGHRAAWGVGRHVLGSQVFDYWFDPWGHMLEHWTDGDLFTASDAPNIATQSELHKVQWGPAFPADIFAGKREAEA